MDKYENKINVDIFRSQSTYQTDFKSFPVERKGRHQCTKVVKIEQEVKTKKKEEFRDRETFAHWRPNVYIPFNLLWRPKDIIGIDPYKPFETPQIQQNVPKEEAIKTRPRVYMSPAISIDDVEDPEIREMICNNIYTTEWTKAIKESKVQSTKRDIPNTTVETSNNAVKLKIDLLPPLPNHFRNKGKNWENTQFKTTVDPTKTFWEYKDPPVKCGACNDPVQGLVSEETKKEIRDLISKDKLRLLHDAPIPGYAGYKPRFSGEVPLAKVDMPVVHPFMSVSQAITKRFQPENTEVHES